MINSDLAKNAKNGVFLAFSEIFLKNKISRQF